MNDNAATQPVRSNEPPDDAEVDVEVLENKSAGLSIISRAEIDQQVATAHQYPRSISDYQKKAMAMLMLNAETAEECIYSLPRKKDGKPIFILGPSVRLAEIVAASYGNLTVTAGVVEEGERFITAQGVCRDLENNLTVGIRAQRRITTSKGYRYNDDMIQMTGNAAVSIALRNSIFRVVPKVLYNPLYQKALAVVRGDEKTIEVRREGTLVAFEKLGYSRAQVFEFLNVKGAVDITLDQLVELIGLGNAIKSGEVKGSDVFVADDPKPKRASESNNGNGKPAKQKNEPAKAAEQSKQAEIDNSSNLSEAKLKELQ